MSIQDEYWLQCWQDKDIKFHQADINVYLLRYFPELQIPTGKSIFVPLCGKSKDMMWLATAGYKVIGCELSQIACQDFFTENQLPVKITPQNSFTVYTSENIQIYCGDFFKLSSPPLPSFAGIYDRAALIALPSDMRKKYAEHIIKLMSADTQILLITTHSTQTVQGPPYSVTHEEIESLFCKKLHIEVLKCKAVADIEPHLIKKGFSDMSQTVYRLSLLSL